MLKFKHFTLNSCVRKFYHDKLRLLLAACLFILIFIAKNFHEAYVRSIKLVLKDVDYKAEDGSISKIAEDLLAELGISAPKVFLTNSRGIILENYSASTGQSL